MSWRHVVFTGSLQCLKALWNMKWNIKYTEGTSSQLFVFASKGCIYFTCQKTDFHSLGDILMGLEVVWGGCFVCGTTGSI